MEKKMLAYFSRPCFNLHASLPEIRHIRHKGDLLWVVHFPLSTSTLSQSLSINHHLNVG